MLAAMDEAVGQIVAAIDAKGLRKDTLFLFSSDNGGPEPGKVTSNGPLRGAKATLYEGGVRVPAFATWEGRIKAGSVVNAPLHVVDWYPTLLKLAGAEPGQSLPLDGRDAWPTIIAGAPSPHDAILLNATPQAGAIRVGDWKLIVRSAGADARDDVHAAEECPPKGDRRQGLGRAVQPRRGPLREARPGGDAPEKVAELRARYDASRPPGRPAQVGPEGGRLPVVPRLGRGGLRRRGAGPAPSPGVNAGPRCGPGAAEGLRPIVSRPLRPISWAANCAGRAG